MIVGIDLGTTNSLVACMRDDKPCIIPNALGDHLTPSVVGIDADGQTLIGRSARELQVTAPDRCVALFKRQMGAEWSVRIAGKTFSAIELSSLVLSSLKQDAEAFLGQPVTRAVITVPAYFNEHQRMATIRAGEIAGLHVDRILNEPTAAAIAYGLQEKDAEKVALVFDLGGGTFDVSIVDVFEGTLEIRSSAGEIFLGGEDFTSVLTIQLLNRRGLVLETCEMRHPLMVSRLRRECEAAKRRLSTAEEVSIHIPGPDGTFADPPETETVRRDEFDAWTDHVLSRVEGPLRRALGDAGLKRRDINQVVLVGGSTRMRSVVDRVKSLFDGEPCCDLNPDEVVALGAAVQAGLIDRSAGLEDLVVTDVAPFTLGVEIVRDLAGTIREGYFLPIINRNSTIPISRVERVGTMAPNQTMIEVRAFQGEGRLVKDNLRIAEFRVDGIPPGQQGQEIDLRFTYDMNGVLEIQATIVKTGHQVSHVVTRYAKGLSPQEIKAAVAAMADLRKHPREDAKNRLLLKWAERLYQELPPMERPRLDNLLTYFEGALESADAAHIKEARAILHSFLSSMDSEHDDTDSGDSLYEPHSGDHPDEW